MLVYHEELKKEEKCPLKSGRANVQIYTENHRIFLEDENGNRYESSRSLYNQKYADGYPFPGILPETGSGQRRSSLEYLQQREA